MALLLALSLVLAIAACSPSAPAVPPASVVATVPPVVASPTDSPAESPGASVAPATPSASTDPRLGMAIGTTPYAGAFAPHGVAFDSATRGLAAGESGATDRAVIGRSTDGGRTWSLLSFDRPGLLDIAAAGGRAWAVMGCDPEGPADCQPSLLRSDDFGRMPGTAGWIVCAGDSAAGSQAKAVLATADDGVTWVVRSSVGFEGGTVGSLSLAGIVQAAALEPGGGGLIGTSHGTFRTKDGGRTWQELSFGDPESHTIEAIDYTSDRTGFALLTDFTIAVKVLLATDDGGTTWLRVAGWPFPG